MTYVALNLRVRLLEADQRRCAYCQTSEANSGARMTYDHWIPQSQRGETIFENLSFACRQCNEFKGEKTSQKDPLTSEIVSLFHPRRQKWEDHFVWDSDGIHIIGLTSTGRATVIALKMNNPVILSARKRWVGAGWHPPK